MNWNTYAFLRISFSDFFYIVPTNNILLFPQTISFIQLCYWYVPVRKYYKENFQFFKNNFWFYLPTKKKSNAKKWWKCFCLHFIECWLSNGKILNIHLNVMWFDYVYSSVRHLWYNGGNLNALLERQHCTFKNELRITNNMFVHNHHTYLKKKST